MLLALLLRSKLASSAAAVIPYSSPIRPAAHSAFDTVRNANERILRQKLTLFLKLHDDLLYPLLLRENRPPINQRGN